MADATKKQLYDNIDQLLINIAQDDQSIEAKIAPLLKPLYGGEFKLTQLEQETPLSLLNRVIHTASRGLGPTVTLEAVRAEIPGILDAYMQLTRDFYGVQSKMFQQIMEISKDPSSFLSAKTAALLIANLYVHMMLLVYSQSVHPHTKGGTSGVFYLPLEMIDELFSIFPMDTKPSTELGVCPYLVFNQAILDRIKANVHLIDEASPTSIREFILPYLGALADISKADQKTLLAQLPSLKRDIAAQLDALKQALPSHTSDADLQTAVTNCCQAIKRIAGRNYFNVWPILGKLTEDCFTPEVKQTLFKGLMPIQQGTIIDPNEAIDKYRDELKPLTKFERGLRLIKHIKARQNSLAMACLEMGAPMNVIGKDKATPLIAAAQVDNVEMLKTLIDRGADLEQTDKHGDTPLLSAAWGDSADACRELVLAGANLTAINKYGYGALANGARRNAYESLLELMAAGAPRPRDFSAMDPMQGALNMDQERSMLALLTDCQTPRVLDQAGRSVLARRVRNDSCLEEKTVEVLVALYKAHKLSLTPDERRAFAEEEIPWDNDAELGENIAKIRELHQQAKLALQSKRRVYAQASQPVSGPGYLQLLQRLLAAPHVDPLHVSAGLNVATTETKGELPQDIKADPATSKPQHPKLRA